MIKMDLLLQNPHAALFLCDMQNSRGSPINTIFLSRRTTAIFCYILLVTCLDCWLSILMLVGNRRKVNVLFIRTVTLFVTIIMHSDCLTMCQIGKMVLKSGADN